MPNDVEKRITAKMVLDSTGFNQSLQGVNQNLKVSQSELKASSAQVGVFGKESDKLRVTAEGLNKQIELQRQKVDIYKESIEKSTNKLQEAVKVRDSLKVKLEEETSKYNQVIKLYGKESEEAGKTKEALDKLTEEYKKKDKQVENTAKTINNYTVNMNKADAELAKMQGELKKTNEQLDKTNNKWITASNVLKDSSEKINSTGEKVNSVGSGLLKLSAPFIAAGVASSKFSMDFQDGMAKVSTVADTSKISIEDLGKGVIDLSDMSGEGFETIQDGLYDTISSGVKAEEATEFLTTAVKAAKGGFTDTATSVDGLTSVINAYGLEASKAKDIANQMFITQNLGKTTFGEMSQYLGNVIPISAALNVKTSELFSSIAVLTANGIKSGEAVTGLKAAMSNIIKPSKEASDAAQALGIDFSVSALQSKGWMGFLTDLREKMKEASPAYDDAIMRQEKYTKLLADSEKAGSKNTKQIEEWKKKLKEAKADVENLAQAQDSQIGAFATMFGSVEGLNSVLTLTSEQGMALYNESMDQMTNGANALDDAFNKVDNTQGNKLRKSLNELKNSSIKFGEAIAPVVSKVADVIESLTNKLSGMDESTLKTIASIGMFTVGLGGVLKVGGGVITTVGSIAGGISKLSAVFGTATVAAEGVGTAAEVAAGVGGAGGLAALGVALGGVVIAAAPYLIAGAAIAGAGYYIHKKLNEDAIPAVDLFADKTETTAKTVTDASGYMAVQYETNVTKISDSTKKAVQSYLDLDKKASESMYDLTTSSAKFTDNMKKDVISKFTEMISQSKTLTQDMKDKQINEFTVMVNQTNELTDYNKNKIVSTYSDMVNKIEGLTEAQKGFVIAGFQMTFSGVNQITQEQSQNIISQYNQMGDMINQGLDKHKQEELAIFQNSFKNNTELTELEKNHILQSVTSEWEGKKTLTNIYEQQIKEIMTKASNERRQLTHEEQAEIADIQNRMKNEAVQALSDTELEAKVIKERMKDYDTRITAEQASEHIKKMNEQVEAVKSKANQEADEVIKAAIRKREAGSISDEEADKIIRSAEKQRDNTINAAVGQKDGVIKAMRDQNADLDREVNVTTGEIKKVKDEWTSGWGNTFKKLSVGFVSSFAGEANGQLYSHWIGANASGTDNWTGGLTTLHEKGYEVYDLPRGTRVYNHEASEDMVLKTAEAVANKMIGNSSPNSGGISVVQNIYSPVNNPSELARQSKKELQKATLSWGG